MAPARYGLTRPSLAIQRLVRICLTAPTSSLTALPLSLSGVSWAWHMGSLNVLAETGSHSSASALTAFDPDLRAGDQLSFVLRANATRDKRQGQGRSTRVDVVMDLLHDLPQAERSNKRLALAGDAATEWMTRQGATKGFTLKHLAVEDYNVQRTPRGRKTATLGVLELSGVIELTEPAVFLTAMASGFGRAKGWGCGLMLIRRYRP